MFPIRGAMRSDGWIRELKKQLKDGVQMVVLILPGAKGKSQLYDDVKRFLLTEYPIPSQVVLHRPFREVRTCGQSSRRF